MPAPFQHPALALSARSGRPQDSRKQSWRHTRMMLALRHAYAKGENGAFRGAACVRLPKAQNDT